MAHLAWLVFLGVFLGTGLVYRIWYQSFRGGRATNRRIRAQAQRDLEARSQARLDEYARRYGVTGHVRAPTAEEIAEVRKKIGWDD
jgi:hypothetical protein